MPELPEVETMVSRLQPYVGSEVLSVVPSEGEDSKRYQEAHFPCTEVLQGVFRRGKFMVFMLDDCALLAHNAMSGYWDERGDPWTFDYVEGKRASTETDVRALIELKDKSKKLRVLQFHDARKFGSLRVMTPEELAEKLSTLGPEADGTTNLYEPAEVMSPVKFDRLLAESKKPLKELLLDQGKIAGVGNIYAAEALWTAGLSPHRPANSLSETERMTLFIAVRAVLRMALDRHLSYAGLRAYRRTHCARCSKEIKVEKIKGRATYWCPTCQK